MVGDAALTPVVGVLLAHNLLIERLPAGAYVPACLGTTGAVVALAGVRPKALGLTVSVPALAAGGAGAAAAVAAVAVAARATTTRPLFHDERRTGRLAYVALVRIPFGTVVLEEIAFRGVLLALTGPLVSSGLFGLWHIVPTNIALNVNDVATTRGRRLAALTGAAVATAVAGVGLCWLRLATGSLLAPAMVHAAATSSATVAAYAVTRPARAIPPARDGAPAPAGSSRRSRRRGHRAAPPRP